MDANAFCRGCWSGRPCQESANLCTFAESSASVGKTGGFILTWRLRVIKRLPTVIFGVGEQSVTLEAVEVRYSRSADAIRHFSSLVCFLLPIRRPTERRADAVAD